MIRFFVVICLSSSSRHFIWWFHNDVFSPSKSLPSWPNPTKPHHKNIVAVEMYWRYSGFIIHPPPSFSFLQMKNWNQRKGYSSHFGNFFYAVGGMKARTLLSESRNKKVCYLSPSFWSWLWCDLCSCSAPSWLCWLFRYKGTMYAGSLGARSILTPTGSSAQLFFVNNFLANMPRSLF